jgi:branched-subunit amino acid aminotransferase/4-amino-4-deoxychorismate lyase
MDPAARYRALTNSSELPWLWVDGRITPADAPALRVDQGLLRGDGCFESGLVHDGTVRALDRHLDRLLTSVVALGLVAPAHRDALQTDLTSGLHSLLAATPGLAAREAIVRMTVTAQSRLIQLLPLTQRQLDRRQGLHLWTIPEPRGESLVHRHKTLGWTANAVWSRLHPAGHDPVFEGLWLDPGGQVLEGTTSSIFIVERQGPRTTVLTPALTRAILAGTSRARVIGSLRDHGLDVVETDLPFARLVQASEVFATSATLPVAPILTVDGRPLRGQPSSDGAEVYKLAERLVG